MSLLPPAEGSEYPDRKSMVTAIQAHAKSNGYAVTIQWSSNKDGTVYLRLRNTGTHLTGCPFSIHGAVKNNIWTFKIYNASHNHSASIGPAAHPIHHHIPHELQA
ncbi:MAG: hypothetical protein M1839_003759 [Geoglossum umbratile]|nr:MAG: hypothetical protein M1839_003759 [Geoglossum umbratile]